MNGLQMVAILCVAGALGLAAIALLSQKKKNSQSLRQGESSSFATLMIRCYSGLSKNPVTRPLLIHVRKRLEFYSDFDERAIRKKTASVFLMTSGLFILLLLVFWILTADAVMLLIFTFILFFMVDTVIELFVSNIQISLMKQQLSYHELLRHKYYELKSVDDANNAACEELNKKGTYEIYTQAERINDIFTDPDTEKSLEKYYDTAPNKYLKMLAGMIYITKEYGDVKRDGHSVFIRSLGYLNSEIRAETFKREKLKLALKSLNIISLVPLFLIKPIRQWAGTNFAPMESFYASKGGIILALMTVMTAFGAYMVLRSIQRFDKTHKPQFTEKTFEDRLYERALYPIVDRLTPGTHTKKRTSLETLLKNTMVPLTVQTLHVRRLLFGLGAFVLGIALFVGLSINTVNSVLYKPETPEGFLGGKVSDEDYAGLMAITDLDRSVILEVDKKPDKDKILEILKQKEFQDEASRTIACERILGKIGRIESCYFKWYELLLSILLFLIGYHVPVLHLSFLQSVRKVDMEEEVSQFQTIILMLMHMNRVHVEEILEWMEMFSLHFKGPIQKCLSNFNSGSLEALEVLKADVAFPPFISLIENLQLAHEDLGIERAFEELEDEITFTQEKRKQLNETIIESKKNLGNMIGFLPVYALVVLYLIIPMIASGVDSMSAFYKQISSF